MAKFFDMVRDESSGGPPPPDKGMKRFFSEIGDELKHLGKQGSHELAAALFTGSAFVMYPHANQGVDDPQHGLPAEAGKEIDRGMSM